MRMVGVENNHANDLLSIITLSIGIVSGVLVLLTGGLAGIIGVLGVILANVAKREDRFNNKYIKVGEIISWITTGLFILSIFYIIIQVVF
ncbi:hypothetical protein ACI2JA_02700 [Alkalihalobacillus sp. NPDC078783]